MPSSRIIIPRGDDLSAGWRLSRFRRRYRIFPRRVRYRRLPQRHAVLAICGGGETAAKRRRFPEDRGHNYDIFMGAAARLHDDQGARTTKVVLSDVQITVLAVVTSASFYTLPPRRVWYDIYRHFARLLLLPLVIRQIVLPPIQECLARKCIFLK